MSWAPVSERQFRTSQRPLGYLLPGRKQSRFKFCTREEM